MRPDDPQPETLANVISAYKVGWSHLQVAALVRYLGGDDKALDDRPEVLRLVQGARRREIREAEFLKRYESLGDQAPPSPGIPGGR